MSDLIDRKIILAKFEDICEMCGKRDENSGVMCRCCYLDDAISMTEDLPSAEPERKKGKWLWKLADNGWVDHICSECGWTKNTDIHVKLSYNFCPNCGADMRGE